MFMNYKFIDKNKTNLSTETRKLFLCIALHKFNESETIVNLHFLKLIITFSQIEVDILPLTTTTIVFYKSKNFSLNITYLYDN